MRTDRAGGRRFKAQGWAYFRVDANARIGSGHLARCRLLAGELMRHGIRCTFLIESTPESLRRSLEAEGHPVVRLPPERSVDAEYLAETFASDGFPLLVVDSDAPEFYEANWQQSIRTRGIWLMMMTFRHDCHFSADLVLNQNLLALYQRYSTEPHAELLLGPRYAMLADEFRHLHDAPLRDRSKPRSLLVTFGGADRQNLTLRVMDALAQLEPPPERVMVIVGSLYARLPELRVLLSEIGHLNPELVIDTKRMPDLMSEADLAISSGGLTAWELACAGVPNVIVSSSERERQTAMLLHREGLACFVGHHDQVSRDDIGHAVRQLGSNPARLRALCAAGRRLVDGRGLDRVIAKVLRAVEGRPKEGCDIDSRA
ncbi:MAG: UDP-2,4-diacetamido-2,4,6-trideoxy-beta-L-altropyranose hydrolase [Gammaproteobacteria bacterium]|nr:UDP-2,4-diacetamido-2,4,6-trideoxy-beta-L-altropyranose hydrolase [Gammaproteobacteria bacterium]